MSKVKALIARLEKSKLGEQLFRVARIAGVAIVAQVVTGHPVDAALIAGAAEAAFRQVFPQSTT